MIKLFITAGIISLMVVLAAHAEPKATYVGQGRWACQGNSAECAQVDSNNRQVEDRRANDFQRDQDRAQRYVDEERRKDEERRNEQRRNP